MARGTITRCDRCGNAFTGLPRLLISYEGRAFRPAIFAEEDRHLDLCHPCHQSLVRWWERGRELPSAESAGRAAWERAVLMDALHEMAIQSEWARVAEANASKPYWLAVGCKCCRHYGPCLEAGQSLTYSCNEQSCTQCDDSDED